mgnify:FL=1
MKPCPHCHGTRRVIGRCPDCDGTGTPDVEMYDSFGDLVDYCVVCAGQKVREMDCDECWCTPGEVEDD